MLVLMEPYFSQNFSPNIEPPTVYKQQLFIDLRDYIDDIIANNGNIEFEVLWSNGRHRTQPIGIWADSLSIPPYDYVTQVELLGVMCPKLENENYFIVDIPEFDGVLHSSDNAGSHDKFAIVYFDSVKKPLKGKDFIPKICHFRPPLQSLNKIRIAFKKYGGTVLNLNNDYTYLNGPYNLQSDDEDLKSILAEFSLLFEFTIKK